MWPWQCHEPQVSSGCLTSRAAPAQAGTPLSGQRWGPGTGRIGAPPWECPCKMLAAAQQLLNSLTGSRPR